MTDTLGKATNVTARHLLREWFERKIEENAGGFMPLDLPALADEAGAMLEERYRGNKTARIEELPYVLRSFAYEIGLEALGATRNTSLHELDLDGSGRWLEHANGVYKPLWRMGPEELKQAAADREKRLARELEVVKKWRELAEGMKPGDKISAQSLADTARKTTPETVETIRANVEEAIRARVSRANSEEWTEFCWYCGTPTEQPEPPEEDEGGPARCVPCVMRWDRAFANSCPAEGEGEGWLHIHAPSSVRVDWINEKVVEAQGSAWCDCCGGTFLYGWKIGQSVEGMEGVAIVSFLGMDGKGKLSEARETINPAS